MRKRIQALLPALKVARATFQTEVMDGNIYAIGGVGNGSSAVSSVEVYISSFEVIKY